ncbi:hypothetical protein J7413_06930 [Shimia sp. R10_1]|nr:hypothetical protein [Shimia sp. R10_1]
MQSALDHDMAWRIKEIAVFKGGAGENGSKRKPFIRAGVALLYAHWEGFVKKSSEIYLEYVESRSLKYKELKTCFVVFGMKGKLDTLVESRKSSANVEAMDFVFSHLDETAKLPIHAAINTGSNLTSKVFSNIATSLDIDTAFYETKYNLIDSSLVARRNKIAHGEFLDIEGREFNALVEEITGLMRQYKTDIENAASQTLYMRSE